MHGYSNPPQSGEDAGLRVSTGNMSTARPSMNTLAVESRVPHAGPSLGAGRAVNRRGENPGLPPHGDRQGADLQGQWHCTEMRSPIPKSLGPTLLGREVQTHQRDRKFPHMR